MALKPSTYPFVPRSNASLRAGQFWSLPLSGGRFACGYVEGTPPPGSLSADRVMFYAGLLDFVADREPRAADLAGATLVTRASFHVKALANTGGRILGHYSGTIGLAPDLERLDRHAWGHVYIRELAERLLQEGRLTSRCSGPAGE